MKELAKLFPFDTYDVRARIIPAVLAVLPIGFLAVSWFPDVFSAFGWPLGIVSSCGLAMLATQLGRHLGKKREPELFRLWGGPPTTRILRHRDHHLNAHTKARYHQKLRDIVPDIKLPDSQREAADPDAADRVYESCVDFLREKTRDQARFGLVHEENMNYGFRRNLWAMKGVGVTSSLVGLAGILLPTVLECRVASVEPLAIGTLVITGLLLWTIRVNISWVEVAANLYAERLLAACDEL